MSNIEHQRDAAFSSFPGSPTRHVVVRRRRKLFTLSTP